MSNFRDFEGMRVRYLGIAPWKLWLAAAGLAALAIAVLTIATGIFLVVVPVVLLAGFAARLFAGHARPPVAPRGPGRGGPLIEGEYTVVSSRPVQPRWREDHR
jgi:hypothetical protein